MGIALILYIDSVILCLDILVIQFQGYPCQLVSENSHLELHELITKVIIIPSFFN